MHDASKLVFLVFPPVHDAGKLVFLVFPPVHDAGKLVFLVFPPVHDAGKLVFLAFPPVHDAGKLVFLVFPPVHVVDKLVFLVFYEPREVTSLERRCQLADIGQPFQEVLVGFGDVYVVVRLHLQQGFCVYPERRLEKEGIPGGNGLSRVQQCALPL